jgi:hypothetical protein
MPISWWNSKKTCAHAPGCQKLSFMWILKSIFRQFERRVRRVNQRARHAHAMFIRLCCAKGLAHVSCKWRRPIHFRYSRLLSCFLAWMHRSADCPRNPKLTGSFLICGVQAERSPGSSMNGSLRRQVMVGSDFRRVEPRAPYSRRPHIQGRAAQVFPAAIDPEEVVAATDLKSENLVMKGGSSWDCCNDAETVSIRFNRVSGPNDPFDWHASVPAHDYNMLYIFATTDEFVLGRTCSTRMCGSTAHITVVDSRLTSTRLSILINEASGTAAKFDRFLTHFFDEGRRRYVHVKGLYSSVCQSAIASFPASPPLLPDLRKLAAAVPGPIRVSHNGQCATVDGDRVRIWVVSDEVIARIKLHSRTTPHGYGVEGVDDFAEDSLANHELSAYIIDAQRNLCGKERYVVVSSQNGPSWAALQNYGETGKVHYTLWVVSGAITHTLFHVWSSLRTVNASTVMLMSVSKTIDGEVFSDEKKRRRRYKRGSEILRRYCVVDNFVDRALDASWGPGKKKAKEVEKQFASDLC